MTSSLPALALRRPSATSRWLLVTLLHPIIAVNSSREALHTVRSFPQQTREASVYNNYAPFQKQMRRNQDALGASPPLSSAVEILQVVLPLDIVPSRRIKH